MNFNVPPSGPAGEEAPSIIIQKEQYGYQRPGRG